MQISTNYFHYDHVEDELFTYLTELAHRVPVTVEAMPEEFTLVGPCGINIQYKKTRQMRGGGIVSWRFTSATSKTTITILNQ